MEYILLYIYIYMTGVQLVTCWVYWAKRSVAAQGLLNIISKVDDFNPT